MLPLVLILIIGLIVFGPGKLPEMGRTLGKGIREFRKASNALSQAINAPENPPQPQAVEQNATLAAAATRNCQGPGSESTGGTCLRSTDAGERAPADCRDEGEAGIRGQREQSSLKAGRNSCARFYYPFMEA